MDQSRTAASSATRAGCWVLGPRPRFLPRWMRRFRRACVGSWSVSVELPTWSAGGRGTSSCSSCRIVGTVTGSTSISVSSASAWSWGTDSPLLPFLFLFFLQRLRRRRPPGFVSSSGWVETAPELDPELDPGILAETEALRGAGWPSWDEVM